MHTQKFIDEPGTYLMQKFHRSIAVIALTLAAAASATAASTAKVETLPSGVKVEQLRVGTGAAPTAMSTVTVNYKGTLANGTVFDSSYTRGVPASFPLGGVIPCWTQALQHMKVGGKARLTCPSQTAYGPAGMSGAIPPNSELTFEVELLSIAK